MITPKKQKPTSIKEAISIAQATDLMNAVSALNLKENPARGNDAVMYKFQLDPARDKSNDKKMRTKLRNKLQYFANIICLHFSKGNTELLRKEAAEFMQFYAEHYIYTDLTLQSIYRGNDESHLALYKAFLQVMKETI